MALTVYTNEVGYFEIDKTKNMPETLSVLVEKADYERTQLVLNKENLNKKVSITMNYEVYLKGDILIEE